MNNGNRLLGPTALLLLAGSAWAGSVDVPSDFPTIQEAIDAAVTGDVVTVSKGIYRENLVITTEGIQLKGKGKDVIVDGAYGGAVLDVQANDVTISGIVFMNGGDPLGETGGILWTGADASMSKCEVRHCVNYGVQLLGTGLVQDNLIVGTLGPGLIVDTDDTAGPLTTIKDNEIVRNTTGIEADDGPFLIDKNTVSNNSGDAITVTVLSAAEGTPSTPTEIRRNLLFGNSGTAIVLVDEIGATTLIDKNDIDENGVGLDLTASNLTVEKNDIDQSLAGGAFLQTTGLTFEDNRMRRNTLVGIVVTTDPAATDGSNTFMDNHFETSGGDGVIVESNGNVFEDNLIKDNLGDGISIASGATGNQLIDNNVRDNGHDGIDNSGTDTLLTDNSTKGNVGADIAGIGDGSGTVDEASSGNTVSDESGLEAEQELELDTLEEPAP